MSTRADGGSHAFRISFTLACLTALLARVAPADSIRGTAIWRERMALPATSIFEAVVDDVSRADAPAHEVARMRLSPAPNPPVTFEVAYDPGRIEPGHRYAMRARVLVGELLMFTTDTATTVLGSEGGNSVSLLLVRAGGAGASEGTSDSSGADEASELAGDEAAGPGSAMVVPSDVMAESEVPLESTRWNAVELEGTVVPNVSDPQRAAHIVLDAEGRFAGSDGCNRVTGSYQVNDDAITFTQAASTQMACLDSGETERQFHAALDDARSYRIVNHALELAGVAGTLVARFEAEYVGGSAAAPAGGGSELGGTSWQLVRFEGGDDTTLTPDDPTKYTLEFAADGSLVARVDCNRGRGTWESSSAGQLTFGPLALTRAMCPPGSLHDQVVRQLGFVRSYVLKDGHLFLALMADGGIYEFEPAAGD